MYQKQVREKADVSARPEGSGAWLRYVQGRDVLRRESRLQDNCQVTLRNARSREIIVEMMSRVELVPALYSVYREPVILYTSIRSTVVHQQCRVVDHIP